MKRVLYDVEGDFFRLAPAFNANVLVFSSRFYSASAMVSRIKRDQFVCQWFLDSRSFFRILQETILFLSF
jgi:hypothetical protein